MPYVLLFFVLMPIIEIAVLLRVGDAIGWLSTLVVVILTAILGTVMLRQQGLATLSRAQQRLGAGEMPAEQLLEGVLLMIGGVLLLTPGFVTDTFGFLCLVPFTRQAIVRYLKSRSVVSLAGVAAGARPMGAGARPGIDPGPRAGSGERSSHGPGPGSASGPQSTPKTGSNDIIDGDYHRLD